MTPATEKAAPIPADRFVDQTILYAPGGPERGNCTEAAVASILGIPLNEVPDFRAGGTEAHKFWSAFRRFIRSRGFEPIMLPGNHCHDVLYLASGQSPRGVNHMVVMRGGELVHDPHPSKAGIGEVETVWLLVPHDCADQASQEERHTPECIANVGEREKRMVVIERDHSGKPTVWCDPCIAPLVEALNDAGIRTVASCCGHLHRPGSIALADGRWLVIGRDEVEWRRIEALFPVDINGEDRSQEERIREDERDRLYASLSETRGLMQRNEPSAWTMATRFWLEQQGAMLPADRARLRGGAS